MCVPLHCFLVCFAGVDVAPDQGIETCSTGKQRSRESKQPFYVDSMSVSLCHYGPPSLPLSTILWIKNLCLKCYYICYLWKQLSDRKSSKAKASWEELTLLHPSFRYGDFCLRIKVLRKLKFSQTLKSGFFFLNKS